ncbi:MAG: beta-galactosidase [Clostridia bacterium]
MKTALSPRQVHLDFHTSEHIPDVGKDFDASLFAKTVKEAWITSMTVFARCHHGWLYYPSKAFPERIHPQLKRPNLLLEQVRALHAEGICAPVYITVQYDYQSALAHPEWLIRKPNGAQEGGSFTDPGFCQALCVNTGYFDYLAAQTMEICELLGHELDGLFFDIVAVRPCWCATCSAQMKARGIDATDEGAVRAFAKQSLDLFKARLTALIRTRSDNCTIFYNSGHIGPVTKASMDAYTHFELESLPSGIWGYLHFPITARYARTLGKDCAGMTGKFHTEWGDFHSLKNQAALEFECFRILSYGFACSIGDQLTPNGRINPATYRLIGRVYRQIAAREAWARPSVPIVEAALVTSERWDSEQQLPDSIMGATQLLEELALQFDVIDVQMDFARYPLLILADETTADEALQEKLDAYVRQGGRILACGSAAANAQGAYPACFGAKHPGKAPLYPDFLIAEGALSSGLDEGNEYVVYLRGEQLVPDGAQVLMCAHAPYFLRKGDWFCSHRYTPSAGKDAYPAVLQNGNVVLFSHPLFSQYRKNAPLWCKQLILNALNRLLPNRIVRHDGPSTLSVSVLHQAQAHRYCVHLLSYIPVRKCADIDIIEERTKQRDVSLTLCLPHAPTSARLVPDGLPLPLVNGVVTIPEIDGYAILELAY